MKKNLLLLNILSSKVQLRTERFKVIFFTMVGYLILASANAQIKVQWINEYNGPANLETYSNAIVIDNNDKIYIAGSTQTGSTGFNYFIRKYTPAGDTLWTTFFDYPGIDVNWQISSFILDSSKNIYILGSIGSNSLQDILTLKFDSNGVFLWSAVYNGPDSLGDNPTKIAVDNNGNVYVAAQVGGWDQQGLLNDRKFWGIIKYNSNGIEQWTKLIGYNGNSYINSKPTDLQIDGNGNIYVTGVRSSIWIGYQGIMTMKYDPSGNQLWSHEYNGQNGNSGSSFSAVGNVLLITPNNNIFMACGFKDTYGTYPNDTIYSYLLTILYDLDGNILLQTADTTECNFKPQKLSIGQDGNICLVGPNSSGFKSGKTPSCFSDTTITIIKYNLSGNLQFISATPINSNIYIYNVIIDSAYNIYAVGRALNEVGKWTSYSSLPVTLKINTFGNMEWLAEYNRGYGAGYLYDVALDSKGNVYSVGYLFNSDYSNVTSVLLKYCSKCNNLISGKVFREKNGDCVQDTAIGEKGLKQWKVKLDPLPLYTMTDSNGYYSFYVDSGNYVISQTFTDTVLYKKCSSTPASYQVTVLPQSSNSGYDFADTIAVYCPHLWVNISSGVLRKCFTNIYTVNYCNNGTDTAFNAYIKINFDTSIIVLTSTFPWNSQSGNTYTFNIGNLSSGQCGSFYIKDSVSCNAMLNSALCTEAIIYPDTICTVINSIWDKSSILVTGKCMNDSLACFTIHNNGLSMTGTSQYSIYENNVLVLSQTFQLITGDSLTVCYPSNGNTIRFEADQRPGHPGNSHPKKIIEGCGTPSAFGNVTSVTQDDADDNKDIDCQIVRGAIDPNEKLVQPEGVTSNKYIASTDELEYQINFQNTGNDTAFFVIIRDTLSHYLNPATAISGASSHQYSFKIYGSGILEWTFDNILLPDSNINELASHGFVKFNVKQMPNNPQGTILKNSAAIYFDYNPPVMTIEVWNMVNYDTTLLNISKPIIYDNKIDIKIYPNPFSTSTTIEINSPIQNSQSKLYFMMYDLLGREIKKLPITNYKLQIERDDLPCGMYIYKINNENEIIAAGKVTIE